MGSKPPRPDRPLALVGLMGAGKSTVGRRLARRLRIPFVDSDEEIELAAGLTVAEIFARYGEAEFRAGERRVIARLVEGAPKVIATGGGAFADAGTRALLLARCTVFWLDCDVATLAERVGRSDHRPLVRDKDPGAVLAELAERRNPLYAEAHFRIGSDRTAHERIVDRIVAAMSGTEAADEAACGRSE